MGVAGAANVLGRSTILDGDDGLGNHFTSIGTDDVGAQDSVRLFVSDDLDQTFAVVVGLGTRIGHEGESSDLVVDLFGNALLLVLSNPGNLRVGVDDGGNGAVLDVAVSTGNVLDSRDPFLLGLVGKHGTVGNVADSTDVGHIGPELLVDHDTAAVVDFDTDLLGAQARGDGSATDGDKHSVKHLDLLFSSLDWLRGDLDLVALDLSTEHFGSHLELEPLLCQDLLELRAARIFRTIHVSNAGRLDVSNPPLIPSYSRKVLVHTGTDGVKKFVDGNFRTEATVDGAELETNDTSTNDGHLFRNVVEGKSARRVDNLHLGVVDGNVGDRGGFGARGNDGVFRRDGGSRSVDAGNGNSGGVDKFAGTFDICDLVLLEQALDTAAELVDRGLLCLHHGREIKADFRNDDSPLFEVVLCHVVVVCVVEQRLGRDAADVQAGTAEGAALFDTDRLSGEDGGFAGKGRRVAILIDSFH